MTEKRYKLIVHVPVTHAHAVREAIGNAGGGHIGEYTHCSFTVVGIGRFKPTDNAVPHIGKAGKYESVEEESIEVSPIDADKIKDVVTAMVEAHPYEETNYELIEIFKMEDVV